MTLRFTARFACMLCAAVTLTSAVSKADPLLTNKTSFRIPFAVESTGGATVAGSAILFTSINGSPMEQSARVESSAGGFQFNAPSDGHYAFAVRMTDAAGQIVGGQQALRSELEVIVDTTAPDLRFQLSEDGPGNVVVVWSCSENKVAPSSLRLEYAEGADGRWQQIANVTEPNGTTTLDVQPGTSVSVRGYVTDLAGNQGNGTAQIILSAPRVETSTGNSAGLTVPATQQPAAPVARVDYVPSPSNTLMGPSPFDADVPVQTEALPQGTVLQFPISGQVSTGLTGQPTTAISIDAAPSPAISGGPIPHQSSAGYSYNDSQTISGYQASSGIQLINNRVFDIAYEVAEVGPSGVGSVELFVTEDNGQKWFRYGKDVDMKTPFQVDTRGEGTFGFAVRVYNGIGFGNAPPQPGEQPAIVVTVDQTAPVVRLASPQVQPSGQGKIILNWQVSDKNLPEAPVRLEYSDSPSGPWTPLFDWQADCHGYEIPIQSGMPHSIFFRLLARDGAGNVSTAQTPQPVIIDQQRPQARLLRVQPVSFAPKFAN